MMNENKMPVIPDDFLMISRPSNTNDIIDLTEINDGDEYEVTSSSVIVSNNSVLPQQAGRRSIRHDSEIYSTETQSGSADDSISILYERIIPKPEVEVINEVIANNDQIESTNSYPFLIGTCDQVILPPEIPEIPDARTSCSSRPINYSLRSRPNPPVVMGTCNEFILSPEDSPIPVPRTSLSQPVNYSTRSTSNAYLLLPPQITQLNEISVGRTSNSPEPFNYRVNVRVRESQAPTVSSSVLAFNESSYQPISVETHTTLGVQRPSQPTTEVPLNLEVTPNVTSSNGSETQKPTVAKIQCGICLEGYDEIVASNRNFAATNCGHVFCNTCIRTALANSSSCPKCRKRVTAKQIHRLYF